jgi:hypothetical protein
MSQHFCTHRPLLMGTRWMITADHPLAAQAGAAILEEGGNAVDAAIAANLTVTTVRPHMCGIGGDLFALIHMGGAGTFAALNASGRAPAKATNSKSWMKGPRSWVPSRRSSWILRLGSQGWSGPQKTGLRHRQVGVIFQVEIDPPNLVTNQSDLSESGIEE